MRSRQRGFLLNPYRFGAGGPTDPNFANVSLLLHFDGADGSTTFTDNSPSPKTPSSVNGNVQIDTAQSKFGGASCLFDGAGDWIEYAANAAFDFGSGNFTIECWVRPASAGVQGALLEYSRANASSDAHQCFTFFVQATNNLYTRVTIGSSGVGFVGTQTLTAGQFNHVAFVRDGGTLRQFVNGVASGTMAVSGSVNADASRVLKIGKYVDASPIYYNGWMDDLRITKGVARYTTGFTPPAAPFPNS